MALKQCNECGQEVSTKAMSCPHCGSVLKRKTGCFTWIVAILFILFLLGSFASKYSYKTFDSINKSELKNMVDNYSRDNSTSTTNPIDNVIPEVVSLAVLLGQYRDNEVRADELYKDKIIQTTGLVEMVKKDIINDTFVILRTGGDFEIPMVQCYFEKQLASQVSQLNKGDNITIKGHLRGLFVNVLVDKCSIVYSNEQQEVVGNERAVSDKELRAIFQQLFLDCRAVAPVPESWDEKEIDEPVKNYIEIKVVPLVKGKITYLIYGKQPPFYGAHSPMYWIYEKTSSGYRQIDALGAHEEVHILKSTHNGYQDIETLYFLSAGTEEYRCKMIFNGIKYMDADCRSKMLR